MTSKRIASDQPTPDSPDSPSAPGGHPPEPEPSDALFPVVGLGASAGGLEAFTLILEHLPSDTGMAFVLVQHLAPDRHSLLSEILSRTTEMPVQEVQEGMTIARNCVYVIPPNTGMTMTRGVFHLTSRDRTHGQQTVIDTFLRSLAADRGNKAIGVILSGGDADGTLGLQAIKEKGGITFAQSEGSAGVKEMPSSAIAAGHVDFILPPIEIAEALANISRHPYIASPPFTDIVEVTDAEPVAVPDQQESLATIFRLLRNYGGVDFTHYKLTTIKRRIFRRMALHRMEHLVDYVSFLQTHPEEVQALCQEMLISVTSFFRDAGAFEVLKDTVFPAIMRDRPPEAPIRIWVAGCSTGEEAYSIAICLLEYLSSRPSRPPIQIFATDVSETAIDRARVGIYSPSQLVDITPERLQRFFVPVEGGFQISKVVRELCIFARQNLVSDPPFSRLDLISCRNVLIYFGTKLQKKVIPIFHYGLLPRGYLMLGNSETVGEFVDLFTLVNRKYKIYARTISSRRIGFDVIAETRPLDILRSPATSREDSGNDMAIYREADRIILNQYAPAGVVVNVRLEILQFRGQTSPYLEPAPGRASLNLGRMARESLRLELQTAIHQAQQENRPIQRVGIPLRELDSTRLDGSVRIRQIKIDVIPFQPEGMSEKFFLILFADLSGPNAESLTADSEADTEGQNVKASDRQQSQERQEIQRLRSELANTRAYLQSIIEEQQATNQDLRIANEEILSSNEELQSTNEELETAKEEIQATNEELSTINEELHRRNLEATQVGNDLQNLLSSINIPILMLDSDLCIRRFTPTAAHLFNLIPTDIGRPFSNINYSLNIPDLAQRLLQVMQTLLVESREVQDQDGHWYDLRMRPYRTSDNRIDGVVLTLVEIDDLKRSSQAIQTAREFADAIIQTIRQSLVVLNEDLRVISANSWFYNTFHVAPEETEGQRIYDLGNGQWDIPALRTLLEHILPDNQQFYNFEVTHEFEHIGVKTMLVNAYRMMQADGSETILLAIEDVTENQGAGDQTAGDQTGDS
jgi:two-component system CheB/CheR fusion protein